jgi:YbbR domain-containing protein
MLWPDFTDRNNWRERFSRDVLVRDAKNSLHSLFMKDWTLKALALGITLVLWYGVTGQRALVTERIPGVYLTFNYPENLVISNDLRQEVTITVTGRRSVLEKLRGRDLVIAVNVSDYGPGTHTIALNSSRAKISLPEGVTHRIEPNAVRIVLENKITRVLPVEVVTEGKVADGYRIYGVTTHPEMVSVRGPQSHVEVLDKVQSERTPLNGQREGFTVESLRLSLPDEKVDLIEATTVKVSFNIGEEWADRTLSNIMLRASEGLKITPEKATVTLAGPRSIIAQVRPEDIEINVQEKGGSLTPTLHILRQDWANRLELRALKPVPALRTAN